MSQSNGEPEGVRLQKVMAAAGVASRRVCEDLIVQGKVKVNGKQVTELGTRINPDVDKVSVSGTPIQLDNSRVYLALNKPYGVVSSMADENGRADLSQFVVGYDRVFNVGRLDAETTGLIIMTNDGDLAHKLAHPKFGVTKTYVARVEGVVTPPIIHKLLSGFDLEDGFIKADKAHIVDVQPGEVVLLENCRVNKGEKKNNEALAKKMAALAFGISVSAIGGAIQLDIDEREHLLKSTAELLSKTLHANNISNEQLISVMFTATPDVTSEFPAVAARELGLGDVPLMCFVEMDVKRALPRTIRIMIYADIPQTRAEIQHIYLRGATALRLDIAQ